MSLGSRCRMSSSATLPWPTARRQLVPLRSVRGHVAARPVPGEVADSCSVPKFDVGWVTCCFAPESALS